MYTVMSIEDKKNKNKHEHEINFKIVFICSILKYNKYLEPRFSFRELHALINLFIYLFKLN